MRPTSIRAVKRLANRIDQVINTSADQLPPDLYRRARDLAIDARLAAEEMEDSCHGTTRQSYSGR